MISFLNTLYKHTHTHTHMHRQTQTYILNCINANDDGDCDDADFASCDNDYFDDDL